MRVNTRAKYINSTRGTSTTSEDGGEPKRNRTEDLLLTSLAPYRWAKPALDYQWWWLLGLSAGNTICDVRRSDWLKLPGQLAARNPLPHLHLLLSEGQTNAGVHSVPRPHKGRQNMRIRIMVSRFGLAVRR